MMDLSDLASKLSGTALFRDSLQEDLEELSGSLTTEEYADAEEIFAEGSSETCLYIVTEGSVAISKMTPGGADQHLVTLPKNSVFGEMAFLLEGQRSGSAKACGNTRLLRLTRSSFDLLLADQRPCATRLLLTLARVLSSRLSFTGDYLIRLAETDSPDAQPRTAEIAELRKRLLTDWDF